MSVFLQQMKGDKIIWALAAVLSIFSILVVYSATGTLAHTYKGGNTEAYLVSHFFRLLVGWCLLYIAYMVHYSRYSQMSTYLLAIAVPMLIITLFFGVNTNDARRWLEIPYFGISFQTSEFAKIALIIYVARTLSAKQEYIKDFKSAFLPILVPVVIICGLIAPANLSTAVLLFVNCLLLMFIGRVNTKYILLLLALGIAMFALLALIGKSFPEFIRAQTWANRLRDFIQEGDNVYQVRQSKIAIAKGGLFGVGPGNSIQRNFLPLPYADFIYSIIIEEYGLVGGFLVMMTYIVLFLRSVSIVARSPKAFGAMLALGLSLSLVMQALANMAVAVHLVPVTGLPLPLISMGGTSVLFTCISFGMILSVSKFIEETK